MSPSARTKSAKRRNRRAWNAATRAEALRLKRPQEIGLLATVELALEEQDAERDKADRQRQAAKRIADSWPCDTYRKRGEISVRQHAAALRLFGDWSSSGLDPWASSFDGIVTSGEARTPGQGPTYAQYQAAMRAIGMQLSGVVSYVVLAGHHASEWAAIRKIKRQDGIACLRFALDVLAEHYASERNLAHASQLVV